MSGKQITEKQVNLYMKSRNSCFTQVVSSAKAGISERSGRRIEKNQLQPCKGKLRDWKTRKDPLESVWDSYLASKLEEQPLLSPMTLLELLQNKYPEQYPDSLLRTLQRRVKRWKALYGKEKEVMFLQDHPAGQQGLSDFTKLKKIAITINGILFDHLLYHFRLAFSGWSYMKVICGGESYPALTEGLQEALWRLGGCPREHRTDHLSAAFKNLKVKDRESKRKEMTERYQSFCEHYNMKSSYNNLGKKHENGGIESPHGHLKRRIEQGLLLRKSNDFKSVEEYQTFIDEVVQRHNRRNAKGIEIERPLLQALPRYKATDFDEVVVKVNTSGAIDVKRVTYTLPSRLVGERLRVHVYDNKIKCYLGSALVFESDRKRPKNNKTRVRVIDYRHLIGSLKKKPQAFRYSKFRDDIFPNDSYRLIWEYVDEKMQPQDACKYFVEILSLSAENNCEEAISEYVLDCLANSNIPKIVELQNRFSLSKNTKNELEVVNIKQHDLKSYDTLLTSTSFLSAEKLPEVQYA